MDRIDEKDLDIMYAEWLKSEEAATKERAQWAADENTIDRIERLHQKAEEEPTSWAEATKDLGEMPPYEHSQDREMER